MFDDLFDWIKLIALISVIGYIIYCVVIGGLRFFSELPAINSLILFSLLLSFLFLMLDATTDKTNMEKKKIYSKIADGFMILVGALALYYLFH